MDDESRYAGETDVLFTSVLLAVMAFAASLFAAHARQRWRTNLTEPMRTEVGVLLKRRLAAFIRGFQMLVHHKMKEIRTLIE